MLIFHMPTPRSRPNALNCGQRFLRPQFIKQRSVGKPFFGRHSGAAELMHHFLLHCVFLVKKGTVISAIYAPPQELSRL